MSNATVTRREFCANAGQALMLVSIAMGHACGGSSTSPSDSNAPQLATVGGTIASGKIALTITSSSPLNAVGGAALVSASGQNFLVAQTSANSFTALTAICTHEGCTVDRFDNSQYVCACHGSHYSTSGAVLQGPATRALQAFPTVFAAGTLTITVG